MKNPFWILIFSYLFCSNLSAREIYSLIRVYPQNEEEVQFLLQNGFDIASFRKGEYIDIVADKQDLYFLSICNFNYEFRIEDMDKEFQVRFGGKDELGAYHTYQEMYMEMIALQNAYPNLVQVVSIGKTIENRDIWAAKVSDNVREEEFEPNVLCIGNHHAREMMTPEIPLYYLKWLINNYGTDPDATFIVNNRIVWIIPSGNPDGHIYVEQGNSSWRKNRRLNSDGSYGVDLNRNFGYMWGYDNQGSSPIPSDETYRGTGPFSEPEAIAIKNLAEQMQFITSINFHSYGQDILIPPGYASGVYPPEPYYSILMDCARQMSERNGYSYGLAWDIMYLSNGRHDDWLLFDTTLKLRTFALEPEVGTEFWPPESRIPIECQENLFGIVLMHKLGGPIFTFIDYEILDPYGDNDRRVDPGETVQMPLKVTNFGLGAAYNCTAKVRCNSQYVSLINDTAWFFTIPFRGSATTQQPHISFQVSQNAPLGTILTFTVTISTPSLDDFVRDIQVEVTDVGFREIYNWNLDQSPNWQIFGSEWEFGVPLGQGGTQAGYPDPTSGYSGQNVYGTRLNGDYAPNTISFLTTGDLDFRNATGLELRFYRWLNVQGGGKDIASIEINSGQGWQEIWRSNFQITENQWNEIKLSLTKSVENKPAVKIRFKLATDGSIQYSGWNIDDISIWGFSPPSQTTPTPSPSSSPTPTATPIMTGTITPALTATPTITPTFTPFSTVTFTPTSTPPTALIPIILIGGYFDTRISSISGGKFYIAAFVRPGQYSVRTLEIYYLGNPTGIYLFDNGSFGDLIAGDNMYAFAIPVFPSGVEKGRYLLELIAIDTYGGKSHTWPYLTVK